MPQGTLKLLAAMNNEDLRKRIEALNKKPLKNAPDTESPEIRALRRKMEKQAARAAQPAAPSERPTGADTIAYSRMPGPKPRNRARDADLRGAARLEEIIAGRFEQASKGPGFYLIELAAVELEAEAAVLHRRFVSLTGHPNGRAVERIATVCGRERISPDDVLFLDLETTCLGTTPIFLVGTMECSAEGFRFRQYFARDYSEEVSMLAAASDRLKSARMLVTFNGKSFDEPYLINRSAAVGVNLATPPAHLDLLHEARRQYGRDLPNCRLQTLEQMVCGRCREDDIPGSEIPAAYHEFVRTGDARRIRLILQHNLYDLLTMADLMNRLWNRE